MIKKMLSLLLFFFLVTASLSPLVSNANSGDFKDVPPHHNAYKEIMNLKNKGYINGYPDGTFKPTTLISRMHVAALFNRALDLKPIRQGSDFSDVPKGHAYYDDIQRVYRAGIFEGVGGNSFNPNALLTRAELARIIDVAFNLEPSTEYTFPDVPNKHWAKDSISTLYAHNITAGDNGLFKLNEHVSRAHYALFLYRALEVINDEQKVQYRTFPLAENHAGIQIHFSKPIEMSTNALSNTANAQIGLTNNGKTLTVSPSSSLVPNEQVHVNLKVNGQNVVFSLTWTGSAWQIGTNPVNVLKKDQQNAIFNKRVDVIQTAWQTLKPSYEGALLAEPSSAKPPYRLGKVHPRELTDALNLTNFFRITSYLPGNIQLNSTFNQEAQAASLLFAVNQEITHNPKKPADMDNTLYQLGHLGASTSNIGYGYQNIPDSIYNGYMSDFSDSNRVRVGHRRWILSPYLKEVGFGLATATNGTNYSAMKVIADNMYDNPRAHHKLITWPAKTAFPADFFGPLDPWSVSLNDDLYDANRIDQINVELTRMTDGRKWTFSKTSQANGFFNIDTDNYGQTPFTIIFQPNNITEYLSGDTFKVTIQNVYKKNGQRENIQFETTFFNLH